MQSRETERGVSSCLPSAQLAVAPDANRALLCLQLYTIRRAVRAGEPQER